MKDEVTTGTFLDAVLQSSVSGIYVYDIDLGRNVFVSPRYTELTGYTLDELNAMSRDEFLELFHPDDRLDVLAHMGEVIGADNGTRVPLQYRFRHKSGRWVWLFGFDVRYQQNGARRFLGSFVDFSSQVAVQQEMEYFAHLAAHDLRAPSRRIRQLLEMILEDHEGALPGPAAERMRVVSAEATRLEGYLTDMREITGVGMHREPKWEEVNLDETIGNVVDLLELEIEGAAATVEVLPHPSVKAAPGLLQVLYRNLLANALRHASRGVHIIVRPLPDDPTVFEVWNDKASIDPSLAGRLFEPFDQGPRSAASGLALAIADRIVQAHGGKLVLVPGPQSVSLQWSFGSES